MRHLLTDLRGNPVYVMSRAARLRTRYQRGRPPLFYLVQNRAWQSVVARAKSHPHEVTVQEDVSKNTCLHNACRLDPPPDIIHALRAASRMKNAEGSTPLHIAASHKITAPSLEALLECAAQQKPPANPSTDSSSWRSKTSVHDSYKSQHPTADLSRCGRAPIHVACLSFRGLEANAFQLLLEATLKDGNVVVDDEYYSKKMLGLDDFFNEEEEWGTLPNSSSHSNLMMAEDEAAQEQSKVVNVMTLRDSTGQTPLGLLFRRYRERMRHVISRVDRLWREHADNPTKASLAAAISVQAELGELWQRARFVLSRLTQERLEKEETDGDPALGGNKPGGKKGPFVMDMDQPLSPGEIAVAQEAAAWSAEQHNMAQIFESAEALEKEARDESPLKRRGSSPSRSFRIVHASVGLIGYGCPPEMIRLAISIHPNQVKEMDEEGNLPIHIASTARSYLGTHFNHLTNGGNDNKSTLAAAAAAAAVAASDEDSMVSDTTGVLSFFSTATVSQTIHAFDKVIKILLQHYPESAKIPQGKTGRLPLVMAVEAGARSWDDGIETLLSAYPPALHGNRKLLSLPLYANVLAMVNNDGSCHTGTSNNNTKKAGVRGVPNHHARAMRSPRGGRRTTPKSKKDKTSRKLTTMFELLKVKPELLVASSSK